MNKSSHNDSINHLKKIDKIIVRLESNHFKLYLVHLSVIAFQVTIYTFLFGYLKNVDFDYKIVLFILVALFINIISFSIFYCSFKFLKMARSFRKMERDLIEKGIFPTYNWNDYKPKSKYGFIFWNELVFSIIILFSTTTITVILII